MIIWDCIVVGAGIAGSVVSNRLLEQDPTLKILLVEAGPNTHELVDLKAIETDPEVTRNHTWSFTSVPQVNVDNRTMSALAGKGLGGGTAINGGSSLTRHEQGAWVRGHKVDYDLWGEMVDDERWTYEGQLPYMRKTETLWDQTTNPSVHGHQGPVNVETPVEMGRIFPLRQPLMDSWRELGVNPLPSLDSNCGDNLGVGNIQENRHHGKRQLASQVYSLNGITVLTDSLVARILVDRSPRGPLVSRGIQLENGTKIFARETILSAGAYNTPKLLMLSGIGPADMLREHGINVILDQPAVGQNLHDHILLPTFWHFADPSAGWAKGSGNPLFEQPQYDLGGFGDFITATKLPRKGLADAIAQDEGGISPNPMLHPLLNRDRAVSSHQLLYSGISADGSAIMLVSVVLITTGRGSVSIQSADIKDDPVIDPNFLGSNFDRFAARETIREAVRLMSSNMTIMGREIIDGDGTDHPLTVDSTDEEVDALVRGHTGGCYHPAGTAAMGTVVDSDLRVMGVSGLRVVDTSVFPVPISANLQVATYALGEQAADIIGSSLWRNVWYW
ncbi:GMC oxidoreductase [Colletotrichum abscissum]